MAAVKIVCNVKERLLKDGTGTLILDLRIDGKRSQKRLGLYTSGKKRKTPADKEAWALAEKIKAKTVTEIAEGKYGFEKSANKKACFVSYFRNIAEDEEKRFKAGKVKSRTFSTYLSALKHLEAYTGGSLRFSALDEVWLEKFKKYLEDEIPSPRTQATYFSKIRAVINRAYRERVINYNPVPAVPHVKKGQSQKIYLVEEELELLMKTPSKHTEWKRAFLFSCFSGLRLSDVESLTWGMIVDNTLHFRQQKTDGFEYMPLSKTALALLHIEERGGDEELVFNLEGRAHRSHYLRTWATKAGVKKKITYHSSRHTFATLLLSKGVDLYTVSKLLGHQDIQTTLIYAKIIDKVKDNAVGALPELEVMV